jgi:hypothetical protein
MHVTLHWLLPWLCACRHHLTLLHATGSTCVRIAKTASPLCPLPPNAQTHLDRAGSQDVSSQVGGVMSHQQLLVAEVAQRPPLHLEHCLALLLLLLALGAPGGQGETTAGCLQG